MNIKKISFLSLNFSNPNPFDIHFRQFPISFHQSIHSLISCPVHKDSTSNKSHPTPASSPSPASPTPSPNPSYPSSPCYCAHHTPTAAPLEGCSSSMYGRHVIEMGWARSKRMGSVAGSSCMSISGVITATGTCFCYALIVSSGRCATGCGLNRVSG